ncbi:MAG: 50S ribosome-binding GTPase [Myxococcota bacterium]|nr:50S ribosome-binding GTPase [Myxococcota bacterium]
MDLDFEQMLRRALEEAVRERGHVNILIAGRTGVGKSTLINAVFQGDFATTGQGRPVTQHTREIQKPGCPLTIFDTRGLEIDAFDEVLSSLETLVRHRCSELDPNKHIHVAWVCVQEDGRRVETAETRLHDMLSRHVPVVGVITKARSDGGFRAEVQQLLPHARNVVRVRALAETFDDGHELPPFGLEELVEITFQLVPDGHKRAFVAAQKASLAKKKSSSQAVIMGAAATAAVAAASPIPFSDAFVLVPIQVGMLAGISATFGLELSTAFLATLVSAAIGSAGATVAGRAIVTGLLKLVPGAGTVAGSLIGAATASALTVTMGEAYVLTLAKLYDEGAGKTPSTSAISAAFAALMEKRRAA